MRRCHAKSNIRRKSWPEQPPIQIAELISSEDVQGQTCTASEMRLSVRLTTSCYRTGITESQLKDAPAFSDALVQLDPVYHYDPSLRFWFGAQRDPQGSTMGPSESGAATLTSLALSGAEYFTWISPIVPSNAKGALSA